MLLYEFLPHGVAAVERGEAGDIDSAADEAVALVLDRLFKHQASHVLVALLDLRDLRVFEIDVIGHDLDAGVERLLRHVLQHFRAAVVDDDALYAQIDRLFDEAALGVVVVARLRNGQLHAERLGLALHARLEGLQPVAAAEEADDGDFHAALVEGRRCALDAGRERLAREKCGGHHGPRQRLQ